MAPDSTSEPGPPTAPPDAVLLFGPFEFDPVPRLLYRGRKEVLLPPRAAAVLEVLLRHPGEVLGKEELLNAVWPDAFVGEDSLTQALSIVRHALGDNPRNPRYIETKPKRGYRFIAEVVARPRSEDGAARVGRAREPASMPGASTSVGPPAAVEDSAADVGALNAGSCLGRYEIVDRLGAGAMGVVWRARDTVLEREVAIKVLPDELVADNAPAAGLEQEAKLLASISHPNVAHIHDLVEAGGVRFAVLELVEGETLDKRLRAGAVSVPEALELGCQIAAGIEAAHQRGVVHRDLKPANIALTATGEAKVLDFGLATSLEVTVFERTGSTAPTPDITVGGSYRGAIVGTAAYMSPEQARGQGADQRSDIWAFGCILYEMLSGHKPFERDTVADTFASIVDHEPDMEVLPAAVPPLARSVVRRCLRKDPRQRLRDVGDARLELEEAAAATSERPLTGTGPSTHGGWRRSIPWGLLVVAAAVAAWGYLRPSPRLPGPVTHLSMELAAGQRLTGGFPEETGVLGLQRPSRTALALSPDGRYLVYAATSGNGRQLWSRALDHQAPAPIPGTEGASNPFFSPDGEWIGFYAAGDWKAVRAGGGEARTVLAGAPPPFGASWGDDDTIVIATGEAEALVRVPATGGAAERLTELGGAYGHRLPHMLPGSSAVLFTALRDMGGESAEVVVKSLRTGEQKVLIGDAADARYLPTGHLVFARQGTLMAVPFDLDSLELTGEPVRVVEDVMQATGASHSVLDTGAAQFSVADAGSLAYVPGGIYPAPSRSLVLVDPQGESRALPLPPAGYSSPRVSPDGSRIAYLVGRRARWDVWIYDVARAIPQRLTSDGSGGALAWSPDGGRLVVSSDRHGGASNLYSMAAEGGGNPVRLTTSDFSQFVSSWSREGPLALVERGVDIVVVAGDGGGPARVFAESPALEQWPVFSPDGKWLAYGSDETGRNEVYVRPYPGPEPAVRISTDGGESPVWSRDGSRLYYRSQGRMMAVDVGTGVAFTFGRPVVLFDASPYLFTTPTRAYDVNAADEFVMVTRDDDPTQPVTRIRVVLNWLDELRRRVPATQ